MKNRKIAWPIPIVIIFLAFLLSANLTAPKNENGGIKFYDGTWGEAVQKSRHEHKLIFLDLYATWCGPCRMLKRNTFADKAVGTFFNSHYINLSIDGETEMGKELMQRYRLHAYPSLLVIGQDEKLLTVSTGYLSPDKLIDLGKNGLEKEIQ